MSDYNQSVVEEFRANHGVVASFGGVPVVLLTTTGAKSGRTRVNPLVPLVEGDRLYVVASARGSDSHPDWYYNLLAHPEVGVEFGDERFDAEAVPVTGPERDRLFAAQVARQSGYADYEKMTTRVIPVIELRRRELKADRSSPERGGDGMLGIRGVAHGGAAYYLTDLGRELPVAEPGRWVGGAAGGLGLEGVVDPAGLHGVLDRRLARTSVAAFDLTFSAPKSVSVVFGLAGEDVARQVVAAHLDAVEGALHYFEHHAVSAVRRAGPERTVIPATGMIGARFTHGVNRNGDPHLHSHVVMANLVHGEDGRWSACDRRGLDAHRRAAGAVYEAGLRDGLTRALGVGWTRPLGRSAEIVGVSDALRGEFSSRSADIRRHLHETGARSKHVAWAATRAPKDPSNFDDATRDWERRAHAVEGAPLALDPGRRPAAVLDEHAFAAAVSLTPHGGVHRRDAVAAFAGAARDGTTARTLESLVTHWVPDPERPLGVAEPVHQRRSVVPANHLLHALGPRPLDPGDHDVWVGAARALDDYRGRWGLERSPDPLGLDHRSGMPADRLAHHLRVTRHLDEARTRLGRRQPAELELDLGLGR